MTFVVMNYQTVLGTTNDIDVVEKIAWKEFKKYCDRAGIPTGAGGVSIPKFWAHQTKNPDSEYWRSKKDHNGNRYWDLAMRGLESYFEGLKLRIYYTVDSESELFIPDVMDWAKLHSENECRHCDSRSWWTKDLNVSWWPIEDERQRLQIRSLIMFGSCPIFRKLTEDIIKAVRES